MSWMSLWHDFPIYWSSVLWQLANEFVMSFVYEFMTRLGEWAGWVRDMNSLSNWVVSFGSSWLSWCQSWLGWCRDSCHWHQLFTNSCHELIIHEIMSRTHPYIYMLVSVVIGLVPWLVSLTLIIHKLMLRTHHSWNHATSSSIHICVRGSRDWNGAMTRVIDNTILQHTATHCNALQRTTTHCNTLQHTATHCTHIHGAMTRVIDNTTLQQTATHCNTLQRTATHCNTLQHTATHCDALQHTATHLNALRHIATHCNALQRTAMPRNTLQHTATHCTHTTNLSTNKRAVNARSHVSCKLFVHTHTTP